MIEIDIRKVFFTKLNFFYPYFLMYAKGKGKRQIDKRTLMRVTKDSHIIYTEDDIDELNPFISFAQDTT